MNYKEIIEKEYPDILIRRHEPIRFEHTEAVYHHYLEYYSFEKLFNYKYAKPTVVDDSIKEVIYKKLENYKEYKNCLFSIYPYNALLEKELLSDDHKLNISINELKFYQDRIDPNRLTNSKLNLEEPVIIVKIGEQLVLYNGYHRTFIKLLRNEKYIIGCIVDI